MKGMLFQSNVSVNELKETMIIPETWMRSQVGEVEESESTEQKYKGMEITRENRSRKYNIWLTGEPEGEKGQMEERQYLNKYKKQIFWA